MQFFALGRLLRLGCLPSQTTESVKIAGIHTNFVRNLELLIHDN